MEKYKLILSLAALSAMSCACGPKWSETPMQGWNLVVQKGGDTLGYSPASGVKLLTVNGYAFKDLSRDGKLDIYEDWRQPYEKRAEDLASKLSIDEIAGLMLYSAHQSIPGKSSGFLGGSTYGGKSFEESGADTAALTDQQKKFLSEDNLRHVLVTTVPNARVAARWNNNVQAFVEGLGHGIPANNSSDPRNETKATAEFNRGAGGEISLWPSHLGLAATFDPSIVERFGEVASREYRALGIATALSPQIDLATEPRWVRFNGTFGEDPDLDADMARAYCDGFQTTPWAKDGWGRLSVNAMIKHWPSGGPEEGGRDAHYCYGKYAVYPGGAFETHLKAFTEGAMALSGPTKSASAVMPYYTISYGVDPSGKNVGNSYSHYIISDLLRGKYGFEGVVCTDWMITADNTAVESFTGKCWGEETRTVAERHFDVIKAGVDQFGGNNDKGPVLEAYKMFAEEFGADSADTRFRQSAKRLLLNIFRAGLFENPYLDPEESAKVVGRPEFMEEGYFAQQKSVVMLKNHGAVLPRSGRAKVYVPQRYFPAQAGFFGGVSGEGHMGYLIDTAIVAKYFDITENPSEADFALAAISEPSSGNGYSVADREKGGNGYLPISLQYRDYTASTARAVSVAGGDPKENFTNRSYRGKTVKTANAKDLELVMNLRKVMGDKPVIAVVSVSRPFVPAEIEPCCDAILLSFGVQSQAVLDVISGAFEPSALLPMQLPKNMETVEAQNEDVPRDMEPYVDADGNSYDFAFGLNWKGVIKDSRVQKYR